jgi:hypothetical protein
MTIYQAKSMPCVRDLKMVAKLRRVRRTKFRPRPIISCAVHAYACALTETRRRGVARARGLDVALKKAPSCAIEWRGVPMRQAKHVALTHDVTTATPCDH